VVFLGPFIIGLLQKVSPNFTTGLLFLAACTALGGVAVLFAKERKKKLEL